ncbi:MAG: TadE/TadG family type IV pilus assembly protein [Hyphomicrobiaceae bacterium]|nr:pilus assembly protein [Hyphomicrobiaceae bacterium]
MQNHNANIRNFAGDQQGSIAIIFAVCLTTLCGCVALAVDFARVTNANSKLGDALDRAALAGAKLMDIDGTTTSDVVQRTTDFFKTQSKILGMPITTAATLNVVVDWTNSGVTASAQLPVQTAFAKTVGMAQINLNKSATVVYKMKKIELSLVLDVTGSMQDTPAGDSMSKIDALKASAKSIVDTMYDLSVNEQAVRIAIAPYSSSVNAGTYASAVAGTTSWSNTCVVERTGLDNATDGFPSGAATLRPYEAPTADASRIDCLTSDIQPLLGRSARTSVKSNIDSFSPQGATAGHIGTAWGWYLISDKWASLFPTASKPAVPSGDVVKTVVVMTDGVFNTSYLNGPSTMSAADETDSYQQFDDLCTNMKLQKINVYTIGFGLGAGGGAGRAEAELRKCATTASNFFLANNSTQLQTAFAAIADRISQLRISK